MRFTGEGLLGCNEASAGKIFGYVTGAPLGARSICTDYKQIMGFLMKGLRGICHKGPKSLLGGP